MYKLSKHVVYLISVSQEAFEHILFRDNLQKYLKHTESYLFFWLHLIKWSTICVCNNATVPNTGCT